MMSETTNKSPQSVAEGPYDSDSDSDERPLINNECEHGSPSKHSGRNAQSKLVKFTRSISSVNLTKESKQDAEAYLDKRVMSPMQERINAITMLPCVVYSLYFLLAGRWVVPRDSYETSGSADAPYDASCISIPVFPNFTALPPLTVAAAAFGLVAHAPFSMLYHWKAASIESAGRIKHWSRRLDHVFIHFASAVASYATSGRLDYFVLNAIFNLDCAFKQFEERIRPRRNVVRIGISIALYVLPVLVYGHYALFLQFVMMFTVGGWLFVTYPFAGWSHSMFHLVLAILPHLVMTAAMQLETSQAQIILALKCASMAKP